MVLILLIQPHLIASFSAPPTPGGGGIVFGVVCLAVRPLIHFCD